MERIFTAVMEEHRDAYYHWHRMIDRGIIPAQDNYLLHIDHHDDMEGMGYCWDLTQMPRNAAEALEFTDQCLGIADFIIPAMWEKTFTTVHLLTELAPARNKISTCSISLMKGSRTCLSVDEDRNAVGDRPHRAVPPWLSEESARKTEITCTVKQGGLNENERYPVHGLVLDVDLDYFCWDDALRFGIPQRIEITREAYREFLDDRDHPFRILPTRLVDVTEKDGKYWLYFVNHIPENPIPDDETILRRIDRLFSYIQRMGIKPSAIDICKSAKSGYLPAQKAGFVEKQFLERLEKLFPIEYF